MTSTSQGKEKPITRVLAAALGFYFLIGPIIAGITNSNFSNEILNSKAIVIAFAVALLIVCIVFGIVLLKIGITGQTPVWLKANIELK